MKRSVLQSMGFFAGNGVVVAQHYGVGNEKEVRANASTGILFLMILGVLSAVIGAVLSRPAYTYLVNVPLQSSVRTYNHLVERAVRLWNGLYHCVGILPERKMAAECENCVTGPQRKNRDH